MIQFIRKYWLFLLSFSWVLSFVFVYQTTFQTDFSTEVSDFQQKFIETEIQLNDFLIRKKEILIKEGVQKLIDQEEESPFHVHIYRNDSLIFWNTNQLPISRFADIHYPAEGIVHLQNGWYYSKLLDQGNVKVVASFLLKSDYKYENEDLNNSFNPIFEVPFSAEILFESESKFSIYNTKKKFVFAFDILENQTIRFYSADTLLALLLLSIITFLLAIYRFNKTVKWTYFWMIPLTVILLRWISLDGNWLWFMQDVAAFQPSLYASSEWYPSFGDYLINISCIVYISFSLLYPFKKINEGSKARWLTLVLYLFSLGFSLYIGDLYRGLVENSSIPLEIDKLFSLNFYSFLALISMGVLFYTYLFLLRSVVLAMKRAGWQVSFLVLLWFLTSVAYFIFEITYGKQLLFLAIWPLLINGFIVINALKSQGSFRFGYGVLLLFLFAVYIAVNLKEFYDLKEKSDRELFANQLASDQDIATEIEYFNLKSAIERDAYLQDLIKQPRGVSISAFREAMERKFFNHYWERYEIEFFFFNQNNEQLINYKNVASSRYSTLEAIINRHSLKSEVDTNMYYIKDYTSQYSYIIRQPIYSNNDSRIGTLYCALKSKKIPEKIGFPRLLISSEAKVFKSLENYSIAKYYNGKLVSSNGKFAYPSSDQGLTKNLRNASGFFEMDDFNHYLLRKTKRDLIVLSKQKQSTLQLLTSFSYLFCFYGFFLLIPLFFQSQQRTQYWNGLSLAVRIQVVLIGLVFVALVAFGWGSGTFVKEQYQVYTNGLIREKIKSVQIEVMQKLGEEERLSIEEQGDYMEFILQKFSTVFVTDINLYDRKGYMLASSRPKIYNIGLVSDQMNPTALWAMNHYKKSELIHQERIGNLMYLSGYVPLYSNEGNLLAYLNLQHFGQQKGFEDQIQQFLVAIMNVFILLLGLSVVTAIFVSNWVTSPLRILQKNFATIQLGKRNKPIEYTANDEIGTLVKDYNQKIEELEIAAKQLAQNERESAWREMAKQVAHEIKNPLTPMKLSLQHLQRIYDPSDPQSKEKIDRVASSIIEQIDALTKIANEFANFAKMPKPNEENLNLVPLLENVILVFSQEVDMEISVQTNEPQVWILADKDLMIRVFNNLIKNAIQSIPPDRNGKIEVILKSVQNKLTIEVRDNGRGIPVAARRKMFVPYFTTKSTGTGLGLAIVKQIVEMHHGSIWYDTVEESGTSFWIELPRVIRINNG